MTDRDHFAPLPPGFGNDSVKSGKFIDIETFGLRATTAVIITGTLTNLTIDGNLTLGTGGVFRTAASGQRVEITAVDFDRVQLFSAHASEAFAGYVYGKYDSTLAAGVLSTQVGSPEDSGASVSTVMVLAAESADASTASAAVLFEAIGAPTLDPIIRARQFRLWLVNGTAAKPSYTFAENINTGTFRLGSNAIGESAAGSLVSFYDTNGRAGAGLDAMGGDSTSTGVRATATLATHVIDGPVTVMATAHAVMGDSAVSGLATLGVDISLNGGSTWSIGTLVPVQTDNALGRQNVSASHIKEGTMTGDVLARLVVAQSVGTVLTTRAGSHVAGIVTKG